MEEPSLFFELLGARFLIEGAGEATSPMRFAGERIDPTSSCLAVLKNGHPLLACHAQQDGIAIVAAASLLDEHRTHLFVADTEARAPARLRQLRLSANVNEGLLWLNFSYQLTGPCPGTTRAFRHCSGALPKMTAMQRCASWADQAYRKLRPQWEI